MGAQTYDLYELHSLHVGKVGCIRAKLELRCLRLELDEGPEMMLTQTTSLVATAPNVQESWAKILEIALPRMNTKISRLTPTEFRMGAVIRLVLSQGWTRQPIGEVQLHEKGRKD